MFYHWKVSSDFHRIGARIGDLDLATETDDSFINPPQNIDVEQVFGHPEFKREFKSPNKGLFNDIALVKLKEDIQFSGKHCAF